MHSDLPKVLHPGAGQPMLRWIVQTCRDAMASRCIIVVGYRGNDVRQALTAVDGCRFVEQHQQLGTGDAVRMAEPAFENSLPGDVLVLAGDGPLIRASTLVKLIEKHHQTQAAATLATAIVDDPNGLGRVIRNDQGQFEAIVEDKDADAKQLKIREINPSYYCFNRALLFDTLKQVGNDNESGEYLLTDVPGLLRTNGHQVSLLDSIPPEDVLSVNTPQQLARVEQIFQNRLADSPNMLRQRA